MNAYRTNRQAASFVALEESLLAQALLELAKYHGSEERRLQFLELIGEWTGYSTHDTRLTQEPECRLIRTPPNCRSIGMHGVSVISCLKGERLITFVPTDANGRARRQFAERQPN